MRLIEATGGHARLGQHASSQTDLTRFAVQADAGQGVTGGQMALEPGIERVDARTGRHRRRYDAERDPELFEEASVLDAKPTSARRGQGRLGIEPGELGQEILARPHRLVRYLPELSRKMLELSSLDRRLPPRRSIGRVSVRLQTWRPRMRCHPWNLPASLLLP